jgi:hypothetical protein
MKLIVLAPALMVAALIICDPAAAQRRGRNANSPPPGPAPRDANGRAILWGATPEDKGVWTPLFGITDPISPADQTPFQPWARALYDARQIHELEPHTRCKASGTARQFQTPYGVEFVNLPDIKRIFIFDIGGPHTFRTVYMDGRPHPADLEPSYYGHSVGHWEGDTLVIDSRGFNESFWMDRRGMPHTTQLHTIERFTRKDAETITYEITVDDPGAYTATWKGGFELGFDHGVELFEYSCQQANYAVELMVGGERSSIDRTSPIVP